MSQSLITIPVGLLKAASDIGGISYRSLIHDAFVITPIDQNTVVVLATDGITAIAVKAALAIPHNLKSTIAINSSDIAQCRFKVNTLHLAAEIREDESLTRQLVVHVDENTTNEFPLNTAEVKSHWSYLISILNQSLESNHNETSSLIQADSNKNAILQAYDTVCRAIHTPRAQRHLTIKTTSRCLSLTSADGSFFAIQHLDNNHPSAPAEWISDINIT